MREPEALALLGIIEPAREHHFDEPSRAEDAPDAHRRPAADEYAALPFRKSVERARVGDPHMRRRGKLEPAADDAAVHRGHHRHEAELDFLEDAVPHLRVTHDAKGVAGLVLGEVEPGAEMLAVPGQN